MERNNSQVASARDAIVNLAIAIHDSKLHVAILFDVRLVIVHRVIVESLHIPFGANVD